MFREIEPGLQQPIPAPAAQAGFLLPDSIFNIQEEMNSQPVLHGLPVLFPLPPALAPPPLRQRLWIASAAGRGQGAEAD